PISDCFYVEQALREQLSIPVFHDDQHGTAIITGAALVNALEIVKKDIGKVRVVFAGAGAAAVASAKHYVRLGVPKDHITLCDELGVLHADRDDLDEYRRRFAVRSKPRTLAEALADADVFVGLSVGGIVTGEMLKPMAPRPIVFALANPDPVMRAYGVERLRFGPDYLIPKPFDPRVLLWVAPAVAWAAVGSGVAGRVIDVDEYRAQLDARLGRAREVMRGLSGRAQQSAQ